LLFSLNLISHNDVTIAPPTAYADPFDRHQHREPDDIQQNHAEDESQRPALCQGRRKRLCFHATNSFTKARNVLATADYRSFPADAAAVVMGTSAASTKSTASPTWSTVRIISIAIRVLSSSTNACEKTMSPNAKYCGAK
jgi:hypothetical protein